VLTSILTQRLSPSCPAHRRPSAREYHTGLLFDYDIRAQIGLSTHCIRHYCEANRRMVCRLTHRASQCNRHPPVVTLNPSHSCILAHPIPTPAFHIPYTISNLLAWSPSSTSSSTTLRPTLGPAPVRRRSGQVPPPPHLPPPPSLDPAARRSHRYPS
jgi:hypothetical protein